MTKDWWPRFKKSFLRNFLDFLNIFAAEDRFIHEHKHKSSEIKEQQRYDSLSKK
jgi:hypothetical protein